MSPEELVGYLASILVFATFYVRTMLPLRMIAIGSNLAFITYAYLEHLLPILILHALLLPINVMRLHEIVKLVKLAGGDSGDDTDIVAILPYMKPCRLRRGDYLFRKDEFSSHMYYVKEGKIRLIELDIVVSQGAIIGEVGLFSPSRKRTGTAVAETDCRLLSMDDKTLYQSYYQNPKIGFYLLRLIARRFSENNSNPPIRTLKE